MSDKNNRNSLLQGALLFTLVILHYFLWVRETNPLPHLDSLAISYYPTLNYLRAAMALGNDYAFLTAEFFGSHYPHGPALIAWFFVSLGLAPAVLARPEILNIMVLLPFLFGSFFLVRQKLLFFISGISLCFFPFTQLCFKQFSPHGLNVAYGFLALLLFRSYLAEKSGKRRNFLLILFVFSFVFSAIAKHLGLIFFINFLITWITWTILRQKFDLKVFFCLMLSLVLMLPFYNMSHQLEYFMTSVKHNPDMSIGLFILSGAGLFFILPLAAFFLRLFSDKRHLPHFFRYGLVLCFATCALSLMIIHEQLWPLSAFIIGYFVILFFMFFYDLSTRRGFLYLYIMISTTHLCMLFGTGAGFISYVIFLPLLLIFLQTISETTSLKFRVFLTVTVVLLSNLFPGLFTLEKYLGYTGRRIYLGLFQSPHHNPLGWQRYCFGDLKKEVMAQWSELDFHKPPYFLVENFGPYTSAQFVFFRNVLYSFPQVKLLEYDEIYKTLYHEYKSDGENAFARLIEQMEVPLLLYTEAMLPEEGVFWPPELDELINSEHFSSESVQDDTLAYALNKKLVQWALETGVLEKYYDCRYLPTANPCVLSCTDKRLSGNGQGINFGMKTLTEVLKKYNGVQ